MQMEQGEEGTLVSMDKLGRRVLTSNETDSLYSCFYIDAVFAWISKSQIYESYY